MLTGYPINLYSESTVPGWSAFLLGLLTAISPCPLATNLTAMGYVSKDIRSKNRVFINGIIYTTGRALTYTLLALVFYMGADQFNLAGAFQQYGEKFIGPVLIIIGLFMLGVIRINFPAFDRLSQKFNSKSHHNYWDVFVLGIVFALAFCPYSGVLYFGMLIPMTIQSASALYLPLVFAVGTGIPVIIFAWLLAYTVSGVGSFYKSIRSFESWFRRVVAILFILIGMYYVYQVWI